MSQDQGFKDSDSSIWAAINELEIKIETNTLLTQENTRITREIKTDTADIIDAFNALRGTFKSIEFLGKLGKPLIWIGGALTILTGFVITVKSQIMALWK